MSVIRKKPFIESVVESLTDEQKASLLSVMNGSGNTIDASFTNLPEADVAPVLFQLEPNNLKTGILIQAETYDVLLAYHRFQDMQIYKLDLSKFAYEKINEYLDINELRRTISGGSGGSAGEMLELELTDYFDIEELGALIEAFSSGTEINGQLENETGIAIDYDKYSTIKATITIPVDFDGTNIPEVVVIYLYKASDISLGDQNIAAQYCGYAVSQSGDITNITTVALNKLSTDGANFKYFDYNIVSYPKKVIANPTLEGTESPLTGLQVGNTKYKVGGGTKLYKHTISSTNLQERIDDTRFSIVDNNITITLNQGSWGAHYTNIIVISKTATPYTSIEDVVKDIENVIRISSREGQQTYISNYVGGYIGSTQTYFLQFFAPSDYNISYKYVNSWKYVKSNGTLTDTVTEL